MIFTNFDVFNLFISSNMLNNLSIKRSLLRGKYFIQQYLFLLLQNIERCYNFMQTPFSKLRREQKIRRQRLIQSLSPATPNLSLSSERQRTFTRKLSNSSITSRKNNRTKLSKTAQKPQQKEHYQVFVKQTLRKTSNSKIQQKNLGKDQNERDQFSLVISGSACGQELMKLRREKLEKMILQIRQNNLALQNYDLPQVGVKKSKYSKSNQHPNHSAEPNSPLFKQKDSVNPKDFLVCQPCPIFEPQNPISPTHQAPFYPSRRRSFLPTENRKQATSLSTCRRSHKTSKTQQIINSLSPKKSTKKGDKDIKGPKLNCFNLNSLNGWQSTPDRQELWQPWCQG